MTPARAAGLLYNSPHDISTGCGDSGVFPPFTDEHDLIRQTVKRFCREEIAPFAQEWDEAGIFPREIFRKAAGLGLFGIRIPTEYGGSGLDWWASAAALESIAWADSPGVGMALDGARRADHSDHQ